MSHGLRSRAALAIATLVVLAAAAPVGAQRGRGGEQAATPRQAAPVDLTGYWVSVVSEDWRYRMATPPKGDTGGVPLNVEGRRVAGEWDPARDAAAGEACRAYGAPGLMRLPGRLHITWQDDRTLKIEADAGTQTRLLHFAGDAHAATGDRAWQGISTATWDAVQGGGASARWGSLRVVTTQLRPGYLRKNGVPYSENAVLTEYFDLHPRSARCDMDHDHDDRQRSEVPRTGIHHEHRLPERGQRLQVEPDAVPRRLIAWKTCGMNLVRPGICLNLNLEKKL